MSGYVPVGECVELPPGFYDLAFTAATHELPHYKNPWAAKNNYMTPLERLTRAMLCQLAFAHWRGIAYDPARLYDHADYGRADIGPYEIKCMGWKRASHMDNCEGGTLYVAAHSRARYQVGMTAFDSTMRERVFVDGWIETARARLFPRGAQSRGRAGLPHLVPYESLAGPDSLP